MEEIEKSKTCRRFAKTRLNEKEYQAFLRVLEGLRTTRSRMLRKMIREVIRTGPDLLLIELQPFHDAVSELRPIGKNLNQLVRAYHSGRLSNNQVDAGLLIEIGGQVTKLGEEIRKVVHRSKNRWVTYGS